MGVTFYLLIYFSHFITDESLDTVHGQVNSTTNFMSSINLFLIRVTKTKSCLFFSLLYHVLLFTRKLKTDFELLQQLMVFTKLQIPEVNK